MTTPIRYENARKTLLGAAAVFAEIESLMGAKVGAYVSPENAARARGLAQGAREVIQSEHGARTGERA